MRLEWRPLRQGEIDHELVWLVVTVGSAVAGAVWLAFSLPWPQCTFLALTGLPCATCGATRASLAFLHGNWGTAWQFNPLVFAALCGVALFNIYALTALCAGKRRLRFAAGKGGGRKAVVALAVLVAINWAYLLRAYW